MEMFRQGSSGKMKKLICIIVLAMLVSGCATPFDWHRQFNNTRSAIASKQNLEGMTKNQVLKQFGKPSTSSIHYLPFGTIEDWTYEDPLYGTMFIKFTDGVVSYAGY